MADERETIITFLGNEDTAVVCSMHPRIWRQCEKLGGEEINPTWGIRDGVKQVRWFRIPTKAIKLRAPRKRVMTEEQRAAVAARLATARKSAHN